MKSIGLGLLILILISCSDLQSNNTMDTGDIYEYISQSGNGLTISTNKKEYYSYETIELSFTIIYFKNFIVQFPDWVSLEKSLGTFEIKEISGPIENDGKLTRQIEMHLEAYLPGLYLFDSLEFNFIDELNQKDRIRTEYLPIPIKSSLIEDQDDIVVEKEFLKESSFNIFYMVLIFILVLLIILSFFYLIKKRNKKAIEYIKRDYRSDLVHLNKDDVNLFYSNLTFLIKDFFHKELNLNLLSHTSDEFIHFLKNYTHVDEEVKTQVYQLFKRADLIKFNDYFPLNDQLDKDKTLSVQLIDDLLQKFANEDKS